MSPRGSRNTQPGPRRGWPSVKGEGYCASRSEAHAKRLGHLYACKDAHGAVRCAWCWKPQD